MVKQQSWIEKWLPELNPAQRIALQLKLYHQVLKAKEIGVLRTDGWEPCINRDEVLKLIDEVFNDGEQA